PPTSPSKRKKLVGSLPNLLHECLTRQKRVALRALLTASDISFDDSQDEEEAANDVAFQEVKDLLLGTVERNEGNSCLILGPPGSGKTAIVERCLSELKVKPIVIRLSGWVQQNDRAAFREMARQLDLQTDGNTISMVPDDEDDSNPFLDTPDTSGPSALPPSSHLHALAAMLPKMKRPTIVIIEGFDHFTLHARQALLYCLLDTVQGCHTGTESKGLAVLGITARVDTINLLEKRVKSRFSGRMIRTAPPNKLNQWIQRAKCIFSTVPENSASDWQDMWSGAVAEFFADRNTIRLLNETFSLTRDVCTLNRILTSTIASLSPASPFPLSSQLASSSASQRSGLRFPFLADLSYPALSLLIASYHAETAGYPFVTFEMLWDYFRVEVRTTAAAPVQLHGGGIGMIDCEKEAFEGLVSQRIFVPAAAPSLVTKAFVRYRGVLGREEIKTAVEQSGQTTLKKWL
ncbi:origin recognition complex subunit 4 C-terminus-domain-containing protein, partial [Mycena floridula]